MIRVIKILYKNFSQKNLIKLYFLVFLLFLTSVFEILGLALILPFLLLVSNINSIESNHYIAYIYHFFNFENHYMFLFFIGGSAIFFSFLGMLLSIYTNIKSIRFASQISISLSKKHIYKNVDKKNVRKRLLSEPNIIANNIVLPLLIVLSKIFMIILILAILLYLNIYITLILFLVLFLIYIVLYKFFSKKISKNIKKIDELKKKRVDLINKYISSNKFDFNNDYLKKEYIFLSNKINIFQSFNIAANKIPRYIMVFLIFSVVVIITSYIAYIEQNNISKVMHKIVLYIVLGIKLLPQIQTLYVNYMKIMNNIGILKKINLII